MLNELAKKYDTDKGRNVVMSGEVYSDVYEKYFFNTRENVSAMMELGVNSGASLKMWRDYFPNAHIYGVDINPDCVGRNLGERITVRICSQEKALEHVKDQIFDIVIDDGSHINQLTRESFNNIWKMVKPGGWYVIEDLGLSYGRDIHVETKAGGWPGMEHIKDENIRWFNDRKEIDFLFKSIIKRMDGVQGDVETIHFYPRMAFIRKTRKV